MVFRTLGAEGRVLELTEEYMTVWYLGVVFLMVPLMANGALRASGDAQTDESHDAGGRHQCHP